MKEDNQKIAEDTNKFIPVQEAEDEAFFTKLEQTLLFKVNCLRVFKTISFSSLFCFLVLFSLQVATTLNVWFYLISFSVVLTISTTTWLFFYLSIQAFQEEYDYGKVSIGIYISYVCLTLASACSITYLILLYLKKIENISSSYTIISIPLYIFLIIAIFYFIFIIPGLYESKLYFEIFLLGTYVLSIFFCLMMLNARLDELSTKQSYFIILLPMYFAFILHLFYISFEKAFGSMTLCDAISKVMIVILLLIDCALVPLKLELHYNIPLWIYGGLLLVSFQIFIADLLCQNQEEIPEKTANK